MSTQLTAPTAAALMEQASTKTKLSDFGPPDFQDGLEAFLVSMNDADARHFTQDGVNMLSAAFVQRLCSRLTTEDWIARHPEVLAQKPERPLLITGLPRTGTSALANVLSLEPSFRCLRAWEQDPPAPPPMLETESQDPRRLRMQSQLEEMQRLNPQAMTMHLYELDATAEDAFLLNLAFRPQSFSQPVFSYHAWWRDCDMRPAYAYQRRIVQLLQSRRPPNRWLFKAPHYVFHLEAVVNAYPDAKFVVTHRDPVKTLPSWASLLSSLYPPGSLALTTPSDFGPRIIEHQAIGMQRMMDARARIGEDRFLDIHHHEFVADPIGVLARVYDFVGLEFTPAARASMMAWSERNRPETFGRHVYTAAQFGMNEHAIRERFAFYTDAFGVRLESFQHA